MKMRDMKMRDMEMRERKMRDRHEQSWLIVYLQQLVTIKQHE